MFKIVESISKDPVRFPIKPGVTLLPGQVISIVNYQGNLVADMCIGKMLPFGLVGNRCFGGNILNFTNKANVYVQRMIVDLNRFDRFYDIEIGNSLYCNNRGFLSSAKPFEDSIVLAKVITPATEEKSCMQILWL